MFWERFFNLCTSNGTKPNPIGKMLGISSGTISKWKTGVIPNGETLIKIADYFNCSVDYLLGRSDKPILIAESKQFDLLTTELIGTFENLSEDNKYILLGEAKKLMKEQSAESKNPPNSDESKLG